MKQKASKFIGERMTGKASKFVEERMAREANNCKFIKERTTTTTTEKVSKQASN